MDVVSLLAKQVAQPVGLRVRQGAVVSVSSYGLTVTIAGSTTQVTGVKYLGSYAPQVGAQVWLLTDGADIFALGHLAPRGTPALQVSAASAISVANGTETAMVLNTVVGSDPWDMWEGVTNPSRITVPLDGWYTFTAHASFAANGSGIRGVKLRSGGSTTLAWQRVSAASSGTTELTVTCGAVTLSASNYVEATVEQTSGGNLNVSPTLRVSYIGPAQ